MACKVLLFEMTYTGAIKQAKINFGITLKIRDGCYALKNHEINCMEFMSYREARSYRKETVLKMAAELLWPNDELPEKFNRPGFTNHQCLSFIEKEIRCNLRKEISL